MRGLLLSTRLDVNKEERVEEQRFQLASRMCGAKGTIVGERMWMRKSEGVIAKAGVEQAAEVIVQEAMRNSRQDYAPNPSGECRA